MNYQNFEEEIHALIAERGAVYFKNGNVLNLERNGEGWTATISGSENYRTKIIGFNEIADWHCECPFDHGPVCKHVAATLYAVQAAMITDQEDSAKARAILEHLSVKELHAIVAEQLETDKPLKEIILSFGGEEE